VAQARRPEQTKSQRHSVRVQASTASAYGVMTWAVRFGKTGEARSDLIEGIEQKVVANLGKEGCGPHVLVRV
jgi:hypothetical protein